jgi:hypothetical protein
MTLKVVSKEIECAVSFNKQGKPRPYKFRYVNEDELNVVVKVDKIIQQELQTYTGVKTWLYKCQSIINGAAKIYELKFEVERCRWFLYRI